MSYLPQWKARLKAITLLGEKAVLKKRFGRCYVCTPAEGGLGHIIRGDGADWQRALADAEARK